MISTLDRPNKIPGDAYRFGAFADGCVLLNKKKNHLPAMGWNSWNAFGSGNTEALTKMMADKMVELGLKELGYRYVVLDDGCYKSERVNGELSNENVKFPSGFRALSDYVHSLGLRFGMYNDIGTNLCAGAAVGTCGHENVDAHSYIEWGVDFLKVDNCYYLWDNATFSAGTNAKYTYAPKIKSIRICGNGIEKFYDAVQDGVLTGQGCKKEEDCVWNIGTFDGTNVGTTPVGIRSGELEFSVEVPVAGEYEVFVTYASGEEPGVGRWMQIGVGDTVAYDEMVVATEDKDTYAEGEGIPVTLVAGANCLRVMNHRRQENTLMSYAALLEELNKVNPEHDIIYSICEWGKTQPHNWGYKVGDSWRILNDITFCVGSDGNPGRGTWFDQGTASVTSQYDKAVVMDEFAGLTKGWNDPDMLMIGMDGLTETMNKTHMTMWCMMNSPLMLGLDLRRVKQGDALHRIIANKELIALNQDALGIQAKRVFTTIPTETPDTDYITNHNRCDILAKPLADGSVAISFINVNDKDYEGTLSITTEQIVKLLGHKMVKADVFAEAKNYEITDLWSGQVTENANGTFKVNGLAACDNVTIRVTPV